MGAMHRGLLLIPFIAVAALAEAQPTGTRGFVNQHLMRANVFDKGLKVTVSPPAGKPLAGRRGRPRDPPRARFRCWTFRWRKKSTPGSSCRTSFRADEKMVLLPIPACPAK